MWGIVWHSFMRPSFALFPKGEMHVDRRILDTSLYKFIDKVLMLIGGGGPPQYFIGVLGWLYQRQTSFRRDPYCQWQLKILGLINWKELFLKINFEKACERIYLCLMKKFDGGKFLGFEWISWVWNCLRFWSINLDPNV